MAKIQPIHGEMSGSIGNNTWSRNKGGQYVRQRRSPTNPTTSRQLAVRNALGTWSRRWSTTLSATERAAWNAWAAANPRPNSLGVVTPRSGQQVYVGFNSALADAGLPSTSSPPPGPPVTVDFTVDATGNIGAPEIVLAFDPAAPIVGDKRVVVRWTGWNSPGSSPNFNQSRVLGYISPTDITTGSATLVAPYVPLVGQHTTIYYSVMDDTGQTSPFLATGCSAT